MRENKRKVKLPILGGSCLLSVFAVLCLTVFAILSLATVQADRRLFDSLGRNTSGFYAADVRAQEILGGLRAGIQEESVTLLEEAGDYQEFSYEVPVSDVQELSCHVRIYGDSTYEILRWNLVRSIPWEGNYDTPVFVD